MRKKLFRLWLAILCTAALTGCGSEENTALEDTESQKVELVVWGAEEDTELMNQIIESFQTKYQEEADLQISFEVQGESQCKDALLGGLEDGADVFTFADDQLNALAAAGALDPIENADEIRSRNLLGAVEAATVNNQLYAYPLTADNGYFLYYNKQYITEEQVKTLDGILEAAAANGKLFTMDWSSAWYVYAFFGNTGLKVGLNDDGITNYCTWNQTDGEIRGVDVASAMLQIAGNPGFASRTDEEFLNGVRDGSVIAGVSGVWNSVAVTEAWGEHIGAARLPTYSCSGRQVQMASFSGCKLIGVNAYSKYPKWASRLASKFAGSMLAGNPSGQDLQEQLNEMAEGVSAR